MKKMHCVSLVQSFRSDDSPKEKRSVWEDRCHEVRQRMINELHLSGHDIAQTMSPAIRLLDNERLWKREMTTLVQFLSADHTMFYSLDYHVGSFSYIDDHYITSPLIPEFSQVGGSVVNQSILDAIFIQKDLPFDHQMKRAFQIERALDEQSVTRLFVRSDIYEHHSDRIDLVDEYLIRTEENGGESILLDKENWHLEDNVMMLARTAN